MEEELILQQPVDRRLGNAPQLPPGPPGAEFDAVEFDSSNAPPRPAEKESSRRRSPSESPPARVKKRRSSSRGRRSPSPVNRRRRSPSPRRNRFRGYSPDRRRFDRRRSPPPSRRRDNRYRGSGGGRGRSSESRSRSRSISPRRGRSRGSNSRWSPKKKPNSPPPINTKAPMPPAVVQQQQQPQPQAQYSVMPPPSRQIYGGTYGPGAPFQQYGVPAPQQSFPAPADAYQIPPPTAPNFNAAYPPPPTWGVNDAYTQQAWMQQPVPDPMSAQMPSKGPQTGAPPVVSVVQMQQPPPSVVVPPPQQQTKLQLQQQQSLNMVPESAAGNITHDAVAQEAENQRDELKRQRASYFKKTTILKKELKMLKEQRRDLNSGAAPPSPTTKGFIDENEKLQNQIQKKLSTIENVIDMLTGIIGEEIPDAEKNDDTASGSPENYKEPAKQREQMLSGTDRTTPKKKHIKTSSSSESTSGSTTSSESTSSGTSSSSEEDGSSAEQLKNKAIESMKSKQKENLKKEAELKIKEEKITVEDQKRFNYIFYDPELHWCQTCDIFPVTAKDYLNHLHTKDHINRERTDTPWHLNMNFDQYPVYENAPTKRTPIRGLTFFVPASAWFCKLCHIWMGDLHCASSHLKSQQHARQYNNFLEKNPHFEVNWFADRQRRENELKAVKATSPPTPAVSKTTTDHKYKKSKKEDKKHKKKSSEKKDKKKKRKHSKRHKKHANTTSSSSTSSDSSSSDNEQHKKKKSNKDIVIKELDNPNPAASIRVAMRKQEDLSKLDEEDFVPPPPSITYREDQPAADEQQESQINVERQMSMVSQNIAGMDMNKQRDDAIMQQWNTVQPVISESEKKLLEQLKGKLKNKSRDEPAPVPPPTSSSTARNSQPAPVKENNRSKRDTSSSYRRDLDSDSRRRRSRSRGRRSRSRSNSRGRNRRDYRRRSRSRSRGGRVSPGWGGRRRRSRSRSLRRRSRSRDKRRRSSRSRTRSGSRGRIEKPIVKHSEFRPRVPEKEKEKDKKSNDSKDKKESSHKKSKTTTANTSTTASTTAAGKKLPFIGKMPVFKKQTSGLLDGTLEKRAEEGGLAYEGPMPAVAFGATTRTHPVPTAAQIQMAMMEDAYGNAPPFHPDAGVMMDYDDLMPDPVQYVNLMGQAPPPPPPAATEETTDGAGETDGVDDADMLPPGIDETESEDFVPKPLSEGPMPRKGPLPKDLEEALNIIFPGEKKPEDDADKQNSAVSAGETQIILDEPVMQPEDLAKEGIHLLTMEDTSMMGGLDEASQMSMNEPLIFNKPQHELKPVPPPLLEDTISQNAADIDLSVIHPPPLPLPPLPLPPPPKPAAPVDMPPTNGIGVMKESKQIKTLEVVETTAADYSIIIPAVHVPEPSDIPMPEMSVTNADEITSAVVYDLDDIPEPPASPTESEKNRRREELDDLAMLGIDEDDMAAQCI